MTDDFQADVTAISQIEAVPTILEVVCRTTGMGFAAVARVTDDRWVACGVRDEIAFGLQPGGELEVETTICSEIRSNRQAVVIDHVAEDPHFHAHHTPALYGFQSYISMPIVLPDGSFFGTLCAIDPKPAKLNTPATIGMFKLFADLIAFHLDAYWRLASSAKDLRDERQDAELREQFIAVLGHDLRNPLASIDAGARLLSRTPLDEKAASILSLIQNSVGRMSGMIDNVLDFARGRLGGGLPLRKSGGIPLRPMLEQVIAELRSTHAERHIQSDFSGVTSVNCDSGRIGQLVSNLVANALTHGAPESVVGVKAACAGGTFELSVSNAGEAISPAAQKELFKPFFRASARPGQQGLGLGLYIASEIARAHGGTLAVSSSADETRFTLRMPVS
jgi:signal transduction histidine kinase